MPNRMPNYMTPDISKLDQLKIAHNEELMWQTTRGRIIERILKQKVFEKTIKLDQKLKYLLQTEFAMLNILEDAKEVEQNLGRERDRIKTIVSSMGEGLIVVDKNYQTVLINKMAEKILEMPENELIGKDIRKITSLLKGDQKVAQNDLPLEKMFKTGEIISVGIDDDFYYFLPSGKKFPVAIIDAPLKNGDEIVGGIIVFRDITIEKSVDKMKSGFVSIASHQLRTPLTSIRWISEMLLSGDVGNIKKNQKEFIEDIDDSVLKLIELINTLLILSRVEAGNIEIKPAEIDLVKFSKDIVKEAEHLIEDKKLKVEIKLLKKIPSIKLDSTILRQVISNLINNSIRYTDKKGKIKISIEQKDKEIIYSVADNGIGIPKKQQNKIFDKFFRADNARLKESNGSGIGLTLVKYLVELWKGKIWFESEEGKGTTFYFTIPLI